LIRKIVLPDPRLFVTWFLITPDDEDSQIIA